MLGAVVLGLGLGLGGCTSDGEPVGHDRADQVDRVLVVSLPGVGWDDVRDHELPNLQRFVQTAAIGDLSTRIGRANASTTDAYMTISAGTRALAPRIDVAVALDANESYGGIPASEILERRLGRIPDGIAYLAIGAALDTNDRSVFGAEAGLLGDHLADAGIDRSVIANADAAEGFVSDEPPPDGSYARGAATALMDSDGIVPGGTVSRLLLVDDPDAPFGHRLDPAAVLGEFDEVWSASDRQVTLVEASDLSRAAAYRPRATPEQARRLRTEALTDADALLGQLLERIDPAHDAVLVVSPVSANRSPALGVAALAAPGIEGGMLQSATTRREGYVQLADLTPTILSLVGLKAPDEIEGRSFQVVGSSRDPGRVTDLADAAEAADFRDRLLPWAVVGIIAVLAVLTAGVLLRERLAPSLRALLGPLAFACLGFVPATFVAARVDAVRSSTGGYVAVIVLVAVLVGAVCTAIERRWPGTGALAAVGATVGLVAIDVLLGAPLQVNSIFGYSVAVAGRFAGLGNLAFALFGSATVVLAALIVDRRGRPGVAVAVGLLVAVVVLEGLPMLGADVGGVLSMVPAFGITALLLVDRRVGLRELAVLGTVTGLAVLSFAFIDAARPDRAQTHLARLAQHVLDARWGPFFDSLTRRWQASFGGTDLAGWVMVTAIIVITALYVVLVLQRQAGPQAPPRHGPAVAAAAGLGVLALVGLVANDSSIAVPATMLIVIVPVVALRVLAADRSRPEATV
ncbi:MAG TPA: hypothetical protein VGO78_07075 [Acidimicrobiales bacterium]|nr:hypothetical protein [Acidimicrobiales bacterium]